jgi:hypothetical protein
MLFDLIVFWLVCQVMPFVGIRFMVVQFFGAITVADKAKTLRTNGKLAFLRLILQYPKKFPALSSSQHHYRPSNCRHNYATYGLIIKGKNRAKRSAPLPAI